MKTELCELFLKHLSDKTKIGNNGHSYSKEYFNLFKDIRNNHIKMLEIGIGNKAIMDPLVGAEYKPGASLRAWKEFFINAQIYSFDIQKEVIFEEDRIKCFEGDQSCNEGLDKVLSKIFDHNGKEFKFDVIIDDGSHILGHQLHTLLYLIKYLKNDGIYVVEDVRFHDIHHFKNLVVPNASISFIHRGENDWDSFIVYKLNS